MLILAPLVGRADTPTLLDLRLLGPLLLWTLTSEVACHLLFQSQWQTCESQVSEDEQRQKKNKKKERKYLFFNYVWPCWF